MTPEQKAAEIRQALEVARAVRAAVECADTDSAARPRLLAQADRIIASGEAELARLAREHGATSHVLPFPARVQ